MERCELLTDDKALVDAASISSL